MSLVVTVALRSRPRRIEILGPMSMSARSCSSAVSMPDMDWILSFVPGPRHGGARMGTSNCDQGFVLGLN